MGRGAKGKSIKYYIDNIDEARLTRGQGLYTASYRHEGREFSCDGRTEKEAVLGLWRILAWEGISEPYEFILYGELHEAQLIHR